MLKRNCDGFQFLSQIWVLGTNSKVRPGWVLFYLNLSGRLSPHVVFLKYGQLYFSLPVFLLEGREGGRLFYLNSRLSGRACSTRADGPRLIFEEETKSLDKEGWGCVVERGWSRWRGAGGGWSLMGAIRAISFLICLHLYFLVLVTLLALTLDCQHKWGSFFLFPYLYRQ